MKDLEGRLKFVEKRVFTLTCLLILTQIAVILLGAGAIAAETEFTIASPDTNDILWFPVSITEYCTRTDTNGFPVHWSRTATDKGDGKGFILGKWEPPIIRFRWGKLNDIMAQSEEDIEATRPGAICTRDDSDG